jgi:hypothetical protein
MMMMNTKINDITVICFDNEGETFDRYAVLYLDLIVHPDFPYHKLYVGMSERPFHPQGFGQHGEMKLSKKEIDGLKKGKNTLPHWGKLIDFESLPTDCQKLVQVDLAMETLASLEMDGLTES